VSDYFQDELKFLGIEPSPAFVREPEGNGVAERFIRTLKEQMLEVADEHERVPVADPLRCDVGPRGHVHHLQPDQVVASVDTLNPAKRGHAKTGHRGGALEPGAWSL
jgi:hypothetical protein